LKSGAGEKWVNNKFYIGFTKDLKLRPARLNSAELGCKAAFNWVKQHKNGQVESTKYRRPLKLIYYEVCLSQADATHREKH
jgi:putative endonuclease